MKTILNSRKCLLFLITFIGLTAFQKSLFCTAFSYAKQSFLIKNSIIRNRSRPSPPSSTSFSTASRSSQLFPTPFFSYSSSCTMKWMFGGKGSGGNMQDAGGIGPQGEYYFVPSKQPTLKAPPHALGKIINLAIFPRNQVLGPLGEEYLGRYVS